MHVEESEIRAAFERLIVRQRDQKEWGKSTHWRETRAGAGSSYAHSFFVLRYIVPGGHPRASFLYSTGVPRVQRWPESGERASGAGDDGDCR